MRSRYADGSLWRRWDLHIHAPGTALKDGFESMDEFVAAVEACDPPLSVLGVTDYCSIRTYIRVREAKERGELPSVDLLIPNIEFRISTQTKRGKGINLHLLISPDEPAHVNLIGEALTRLKIRIKNTDIPCTDDGLRRLGRLHDPEQTNSEAQYRDGVNQFKIDFSLFAKWWEDEQWIQRNSLVAIEAGSMDGVSGLQHDAGYRAMREELQRFAHIIFSPNRGDREYWLGQGADSRELIIDKYGNLKPCVSASDAHSAERLRTQEPDHYCWIKANPTFEGLRQILYEPETRVHIGSTAPSQHDDDSVLTSVSIKEAHGWLEETELPLNQGLIAVIGPRGSGKTALADLIALAAGAKPDPKESFFARAGSNLRNLEIKLSWRSGRHSTVILGKSESDLAEPEVRYLSQKFVERLCSGDQQAQELTREVEGVVFNALSETHSLGASSFGALVDLRTGALREARDSVQDQIRECNRQISEIDRDARRLPFYRRALDDRKRRLQALRAQMPKFQTGLNKKIVGELEAIQKERETRREAIDAQRQVEQKCDDLLIRLASLKRDVELKWHDLRSTALDIGIKESIVDGAKPRIASSLEEAVKEKRSAVRSEIKKWTGDPAATETETATLHGLQRKAESLQKQLAIGKERQKQLVKLQKDITEEERNEKRQTDVIRRIETESPKERDLLVERRRTLYADYFSLLSQESGILEELYAPLRSNLDKQGDQEKRLQLFVERDIDVEGWLTRGEELFDQRKTADTFGETGPIREIVFGKLESAWRSGTAEDREGCLNEIVQALGGRDASSKLKKDVDLVRVADWLFSVDHIRLRYGIRYDGVDLKNLSPGTKGIVLLLLYLAVDREDRRPIVIDQPEENLDNRSVYSLLMGYFREAKQRRQVIIITHNPNLVVNTDSEQVIVAHNEPRDQNLPHMSYHVGALEATDIDPRLGGTIRQATIDILEGGREAFEMRERKYGYDRRYRR